MRMSAGDLSCHFTVNHRRPHCVSYCESQMSLLVAACCLQVTIAFQTAASPSWEFLEPPGEFLRCHMTDHSH